MKLITYILIFANAFFLGANIINREYGFAAINLLGLIAAFSSLVELSDETNH